MAKKNEEKIVYTKEVLITHFKDDALLAKALLEDDKLYTIEEAEKQMANWKGENIT